MSTHRWCCCGGGGGGPNPCQFCSNASYAAAYNMTGITGIVTYQKGPQYPPTNTCNQQDPCHSTTDCYLTIERIGTFLINVMPAPVYKVPYLNACCYATRQLTVQLTASVTFTVWMQDCIRQCPVVSRTITQTFTAEAPACLAVSCYSSGGVSGLYHQLQICGGSWNDYQDGFLYNPAVCACTQAELDAMFSIQTPAAFPRISICWESPLKPLNQLVPGDFTLANWCGCQNVGCYDPLYGQPQCLGLGCDGATDGDAFWGQDPIISVAHDPQNPPPPCDPIFCMFAPQGSRWGCAPGLCVGTASALNTNCSTCEYTQNISPPTYA